MSAVYFDADDIGLPVIILTEMKIAGGLVRRGYSYSKLQEKMITHSLPYVHKYGWTDNAILAACNNLDYSAASQRLIRPFDMIAYSMSQWNKTALRTVDDTNFGGCKRISERIHFAIKERLSLELEFIDTWNQAMAIGAHPDNISRTKDLLWEYSDEVWRRCGDTSTDYNYYTKRILFNTAYASTELHLLTDQSNGKEASWEFLDRRLRDILSLGKGINDLKTVGGAAVDGVFSLFNAFKQPPQSEIRTPIRNYEPLVETVSSAETIPKVETVSEVKN